MDVSDANPIGWTSFVANLVDEGIATRSGIRWTRPGRVVDSSAGDLSLYDGAVVAPATPRAHAHSGEVLSCGPLEVKCDRCGATLSQKDAASLANSDISSIDEGTAKNR